MAKATIADRAIGGPKTSAQATRKEFRVAAVWELERGAGCSAFLLPLLSPSEKLAQSSAGVYTAVLIV